MRKSSVAVGALCSALLLLSPSVAWAHATFVGAPSGYPTNTDQVLTLNVPHERDDATYNVDVLVAIPDGWTALSCQTKATWTCSLATVDGRPVVRYTKGAGTAQAEDEAFMFTARTASTVGSFGFPTVQTYNTGEAVRWIGAAGSARPTPTLATLPGGTAPQTTPPTTNPDAPPSTATTAPAPPPTVATSAPTSSVATTSGATSTSTTSSSSTSAPASTSAAASSTTTSQPEPDDDGGGVPVAAVVAAFVIAGAVGGALTYRLKRSSRVG